MWKAVLAVGLLMALQSSGALAQAGGAPLGPDEARAAAQSRLAVQADGGLAPRWVGAELAEPIVLYDFDGTVAGYLFAVRQAGEAAGYLTVAARRQPNPVLEFAIEGRHPLSSLSADIDPMLATRIAAAEPLYLGPLAYAYQLGPADGGAAQPEDGTVQLLNAMDGSIFEIATPEADNPTVDANPDADQTDDSAVVAWPMPDEAEAPADEAEPPAGETEAPVDDADAPADMLASRRLGDTPDWNQFRGDPRTDGYDCYSGCTPTAAVVAMGYWDRQGYGELIGGDNWRRAINEMRDHMGTRCNGSQGSTSIGNISPGIEGYALAKGYVFRSERWCPTCSNQQRFAAFRTEIDARRPPLVDLFNHADYGDHSVVGIDYQIDGSFMVVRDNWPSTAADAYVQVTGSIQLHTIHPPADPRQEGPVAISDSLQAGDRALFTIRVKNYANTPTVAIHPYIEGTNSAGQFWRADGSQPASAVIQPGQTVTFVVRHDLWSAGTWTANGIFLWNNTANRYWKPLPANGQNQRFSFGVAPDDDGRTLSAGESLSGLIQPATDQDTYYFNAGAGQSVTIQMIATGSGLDSFLDVYDPSDRRVAEDDDSGGSRNARINDLMLSQSGRYRVVARSYAGRSSGGYLVSLTATQACSASQYRAEYFDNRGLSGSPALVRCDGWPINWSWGYGGPGGGIGSDGFSVRWTGTAYISAGTYRFTTRADDGIRVWLDGSLIVNSWRSQPYTDYTQTRYVSSGTHSIRVEYYDNSSAADVYFGWIRTLPAYP